VKNSKWHRSGTHFVWKMLALFWAFGPENMLAPFSGGVSDTRPFVSLNTQNPVSLRFLIF